MVTIIAHKTFTNKEGEVFNSLVLQGGIEAVQSKSTSRFYLTARKATIFSTFDEETCKRLVGTKLPGEIEKVQCEPYEYTIESTGESVTLDYSWNYNPNKLSLEETVLEVEKEFV